MTPSFSEMKKVLDDMFGAKGLEGIDPFAPKKGLSLGGFPGGLQEALNDPIAAKSAIYEAEYLILSITATKYMTRYIDLLEELRRKNA